MELVGVLQDMGVVEVGGGVAGVEADGLGEADAGEVVAVEAVLDDGEGVEDAHFGGGVGRLVDGAVEKLVRVGELPPLGEEAGAVFERVEIGEVCAFGVFKGADRARVVAREGLGGAEVVVEVRGRRRLAGGAVEGLGGGGVLAVAQGGLALFGGLLAVAAAGEERRNGRQRKDGGKTQDGKLDFHTLYFTFCNGLYQARKSVGGLPLLS